MEVTNVIRYVDTEVRDEVDAKKLVKELLPEWKSEDIVQSEIPQGRVNKIILLHKKSDACLQEALIVRINGTNLDSVMDINKQVMAYQVGVAACCSTPMRAIFRNGFVYDYAKGRTLTAKDVNDPVIIRQVARNLAQLHLQDINQIQLVDARGMPAKMDIKDGLSTTLRRAALSYPDHLKFPERDAIFQKHKIQKEEYVFYTEKVVHLLAELGFIICVSHGDCNISNIVYNGDTGDVFFLDYELTDFRPEAMDLCAIFGNRILWDCVGICKQDDPQLTSEARQLWIRSYLERKFELFGKDPELISDTDMEKADIEHRITGFALTTLNLAYLIEFAKIPDFYCNTMKMYPDYAQLWHQQKHQLDDLATRYKATVI